MIPVIILYAVVASVFPLAKAALIHVQPIFLVSIRMLVGGAVLLLYQYIRDRSKFFWGKQYFLPLLSLTIFNIYLTTVLEFWGLQFLESFKACFIYNLSPFFAALFSYLFFAERMNIRKWIGLAIGFVGFFPILMHQSAGEQALGGFAFVSWAELAVLCAAITTVIGWTTMRKLVRNSAYSGVMANGVSMVFGGIISLVTSLFVESWNPSPIVNFWPFMIYMLLITFISNIIGYNVYGALLKHYTATFLSFAGFMAPLFAAVYGWFFLGEIISWHFIISTIAVFIGLLIFYREEIRQGYIVQQ